MSNESADIVRMLNADLDEWGDAGLDRVTEADWRLFTTLVRFDPVYLTHHRLNPSGIVPKGPALDYWAPHGRG